MKDQKTKHTAPTRICRLNGLFSLWWVLTLGVFVSQTAFAFSLEDHSQITAQAIREFSACYPEALPDGAAEALIQGNLQEDTNLVRKWYRYSHFYHPHKHLEMRRLDSSVRVGELEGDLHQILSGALDTDVGSDASQDWRAIFKSLGHAIHHIQDMASPLHVVPVMHSLNEPFESYRSAADDYPASPPSEIDCAIWDSVEAGSLLYIHREMALATLGAVSSPLNIVRNQTWLETTWESFWKESEDSRFGHYGFLGNHFGETTFDEEGFRYEVAVESYADFRRSQLRNAIDGTKAALLWMKQGGTKQGIDPELK